jgi:LPXTG-motif cell wall-anchored protein
MSKKLALPTLLLLVVPATALADDDDHGHDHADAINWDGDATEDCSIADPGTMVWELTEAEDAGYVELHIDEPEASVTSVDGPPHRWTSELYPLEEIEADADNIHGDLGDDAELLATYCPADTLPHTGGPVTLLALTGTAMVGGGLALRRRRG